MAASSDVTVVIPTHARDALLDEAIASVAAQRLPPVGLVVCDDVGAEATRHLVERWAGEAPFPVRYLDTSGPQAGTAGASRNAGAALAVTSRIAFLDDDDVWGPDFLTETVASLEAGDVDLVVAWTAADAPDFHMERMRPGLSAADVVARNPGFVGSNFVIRTTAFRSLDGFDASLPVSNDKDLLVRALLAGMRYRVVERELVTNRIHGLGQLTDKSPRRAAGIRRYMAKHDALLTARDKRYLRAQLASVERVTADARGARWRHTVRLACLRALLALERR